MAIIYTKLADEIIVDEADYDWLTRWKWTLVANGRYAARSVYDRTTQKPHLLYMHRLIMAPPEGMTIDHIDRNGLNNSRSNLRVVTLRENCRNKRGKLNGASQYKGVVHNKTQDLWIVRYQLPGEVFYIGGFRNETDAARAYDAYAARLGSSLEYLNFPNDAPLALSVIDTILQEQAVQSGRSSRYKGVNWHSSAGKWQASLRVNGEFVLREFYSHEDDAAAAYDEAAFQHLGIRARLNWSERKLSALLTSKST